MLLVVKRNRKDNKVAILDTDDMVVESLDFDYIKKVGIPVSGMFWGSSVRHTYVYRNGIIKSVKPSSTSFKNVKVTCELPCSADYLAGFQRDNSFWFNYEYMESLFSTSPIMSLLSFMVALKILDVKKDGVFTIKFNNHSIEYTDYGADNLFVLYLSVLYEYRYGREKPSFEVIVGKLCSSSGRIENADILPDIEKIYDNIAVFACNDSIYFADEVCNISVPMSILDSALDIKSKRLLNTKYAVMNKSAKIDMVSGSAVVESCDKFVISDTNTEYIFKGSVVIRELNILKPDAKIKVEARAKLRINKFYCACEDKKVVSRFTKYINMNFIESYVVKKSVFSKDVFDKLVSEVFKIKAFEFDIIDIDTEEEMVKFVKMVLSDREMESLKNDSSISRELYSKISLIGGMHGFVFLPSSLQNLLDASRFSYLDMGDFLSANASRLCSSINIYEQNFSNYLHAKAFKYKGTIYNKERMGEIYDELVAFVNEFLGEVDEISKRSGIKPVYKSYESQYYVPCQFGGDEEDTVFIKSLKAYEKAVSIMTNMVNIVIPAIKEKIGVVADFVIKPDTPTRIVRSEDCGFEVIFTSFRKEGSLLFPGVVETDALMYFLESLGLGYTFKIFTDNTRYMLKAVEDYDISRISVGSLGVYRWLINSDLCQYISELDISRVDMKDLASNGAFINTACSLYPKPTGFKFSCTKKQYDYLSNQYVSVKNSSSLFKINYGGSKYGKI